MNVAIFLDDDGAGVGSDHMDEASYQLAMGGSIRMRRSKEPGETEDEGRNEAARKRADVTEQRVCEVIVGHARDAGRDARPA